MNCRYYITDCTNPYRNLAAEELLLKCSEPDEIVLYLWQNDNTVVIGRNQDAWRECRADLLEADGGHLARRLSGGGAVYHDMGNQNFTFFARKANYSVETNTEIIRLAARRFGVEAIRTGRNDIVAQGRKFSGNAFFSSGDYYYHHGTILISSEMKKLGKYLNPSPEKLAGKGVTSVQARVVNLCEIAPDITPVLMRQALVDALGQVCGSSPQPVAENILPVSEWDALTEKYASSEWRMGTPLQYTTRFCRRLSFGEIELQLCVFKGRIQQIRVYSDAMDALWVQSVEQALLHQEYTEEKIKTALESVAPLQPEQTMELMAFIEASMAPSISELPL